MLTARDTVHALLTGYLVSVLTLAWLAAAGGLLWLVGAVWGPLIEGALTWLGVWADDIARAGLMAAFGVLGVVCLGALFVPLMPLGGRGGPC